MLSCTKNYYFAHEDRRSIYIYMYSDYLLLFRMYVISIFMIASIAIAGEAVPDLQIYPNEK